MATINDWNKYINQVHEFALVENRVRYERDRTEDDGLRNLFTHILYANFGVYP
jgi:hypothetical protein